MALMKDKLKSHPHHVSCDFGISHFNKTKRTKEFVDAIDAAVGQARGKPDKIAPTIPTNLVVTATTTSLSLSWTASTDNVGVIGYKVNINGGPLITVTSTSYTFSGLASGQTYTLTARAFDAKNNTSLPASTNGTTVAVTTTTSTSTTSTTTSAGTTTTTSTSTSTSTSSTTSTTTVGDTQAPSIPSITSVSATETTLTLTWAASTDNIAVVGYSVASETISVSTTGTSYTFTGLTAGTTYHLSVAAFDANGNVSQAATTVATTLQVTVSPNTALILLDFDGQLVTGTSWNTNGPINAAYSGLTLDEQEDILTEIRRVYAPYDVVVTADAGLFNIANPNRRQRIIFTESWEWYGSAGGVAFLGSMFWGSDNPCWVFTSLLSYNVRYIWSAGAHEAGHTITLRHQSVYDADCVKTSEYNYGDGTTAPIMGAAYSRTPLWWIGPSSIACSCPTCGVIQDDHAILTTKLGLKP